MRSANAWFADLYAVEADAEVMPTAQIEEVAWRGVGTSAAHGQH
jgi:hypothetical protein